MVKLKIPEFNPGWMAIEGLENSGKAFAICLSHRWEWELDLSLATQEERVAWRGAEMAALAEFCWLQHKTVRANGQVVRNDKEILAIASRFPGTKFSYNKTEEGLEITFS